MGKIRNRQLDSGRGVNDRKYKAEGSYQHVKPKWEEAQEEAVQQLKEFEEVEFDYSELPLEELEEELQMYNDDIKKLRRAIADKKKEAEGTVVPPVKKKPTTQSK